MSYGPAVPHASMTGEVWRRVRAAWRENDNVRRGDGRVALLFLLRGLIDSFLYMIGINDPPGWLNSTVWAMPALIIFGVWRQIGFSMVLFLAALQGVPRPLLDAASVDGAGAWQRFRHVTLPMVSPSTFFVIIITTIGSFQLFDQAFVLTSGRFFPDNATNTLVGYLYQT